MDNEEASRLFALRRYDILDTPPEPNFDRITALAASIFDKPVCTLSLADADRHWFKSRHGVSVSELPRRMSFCDETISGDGVFVVEDALVDPRFALAPVVSGSPHLRFYAGAPLVTPLGARIGSLCVLDTRPDGGFDPRQQAILAGLAATVVELMEARSREIDLARCSAEIAHLARHDPLTGLPNRRFLAEDLERASMGLGAGGEIAVLYLDLDGFKTVNDRFGHLVGDVLLRLVADRLRANVPPGCSLARLGGDEFVMLLTGSRDAYRAAEALAGRVIEVIGKPFFVEDIGLTIGVSIGVAVGTGPVGTLDEILSDADGALYLAKARGRGRCMFAPRPGTPRRRVHPPVTATGRAA